MVAETLEHKVLGPGNFAENVAEFERWDSIAEIQARRAGTPLDGIVIPEEKKESMLGKWFYASNAAAYSIQDGNHVLEIYDLNNSEHFPDKSEFVTTLREDENYFSKLPNLEDSAKTINLSDGQFKRFVTKDNDNYSHITYKISDVMQGKDHFESVYGTEATKLFTAMHGEEVYSQEGVKGRFRKNLGATNIYFVNQDVTVERLTGKEDGTKLLRGAYLLRLDVGSLVGLDVRFDDDNVRVSGVVERSGEAGDTEKGQLGMPYKTAQDELKKLVQPTSPLFAPLKQFVDKLYQTE